MSRMNPELFIKQAESIAEARLLAKGKRPEFLEKAAESYLKGRGMARDVMSKYAAATHVSANSGSNVSPEYISRLYDVLEKLGAAPSPTKNIFKNIGARIGYGAKNLKDSFTQAKDVAKHTGIEQRSKQRRDANVKHVVEKRNLRKDVRASKKTITQHEEELKKLRKANAALSEQALAAQQDPELKPSFFDTKGGRALTIGGLAGTGLVLGTGHILRAANSNDDTRR